MTYIAGDDIRQTLREVERRVVLEAVNGKLVEIRYDNGTVETPFYETDGTFAGSKIAFPDGSITYATPRADGKMTFDAIILPDGSTARLFATYDEIGERVGGVARDASGYT